MSLPESESDRARRSLIAHLQSDQLFGIDEFPSTQRRATPSQPAVAKPPSSGAAPVLERPSRPPNVRTLVPPLREELGSPEKRRALEAIEAEIAACADCGLHARRTYTVPGEGNVDADLLFIGEGPGADEDRSGRPFVGKAGELLSKIIQAMGFSRETVYVANVVKCRPPANRTPEEDEMGACLPFLRRQIEIIGPRVICALGRPATHTLLRTTAPIGQLRGKRARFGDIPVIPTFHPAYLLRNPADKIKVWQDVQLVAKLVEELGGTVPFPTAG